MKVLVTGATGFIGRNCLPLLVARNYDVHAISRRASAEIDQPGVTWHQVDLLRPGSAAKLIGQLQPECLLHLAWYTTPGKFWEARENIDWTRSSLELLAAFADHKGKRVVCAGSCAEYQNSAGECSENRTPLLPVTLYGTCKHASRAILHLFSQQTGLSSAWGRIFFLYGPHEDPTRVVAYVVNSLLQGQPALCSQGTQVIDILHVQDAASAFVALLGSRVQGPVNIASGQPVTLRQLLEEIGRQLGCPELIHFGSRPSTTEQAQSWANTSRLIKEVGWKPQYNLTGGIEHAIQFWRASSERLTQPNHRKEHEPVT
jgi:nucleoside-diphosphate-sugar epimerase